MLITFDDLSTLAKTCTAAPSEAERGIREAERFDIIPKIGAELYLAIQENPVAFAAVLNEGAIYSDKCGSKGMCQGLRVAIAYYAEARICRGNNVQLDRYGANIKQNEYSMNADNKQIDAEARYLESCGDKAMDTVMAYIEEHRNDEVFAPYVQKQRPEDRNQFESITFLNRF